MNKKMLIVLVVVIAIIVVGAAAIMMNGALNDQTGNPIKITSDSQAKSTITDIGTDLSGISNTLDNLGGTLTDTNHP